MIIKLIFIVQIKYYKTNTFITSYKFELSKMNVIIGNHVNKDGMSLDASLLENIKTAKEAGVKMSACQVFLVGPRNSKVNVNIEERKQLKKTCADNNITLFVHGSYLDNPWGNKPQFGVHIIKQELELCDEVGARGLIIHLAERSPQEIAAILPGLLSKNPSTCLYLEIDSYKSSENTHETIPKLAKLFYEIAKIDPSLKKRVGLCVDTAHLWAGGLALTEYVDAKKWFDDLSLITDLDQSNILIHLNDQIWELNQGRDEHAPLLYGTIWKKYHESNHLDFTQSGLYAILQFMARTKTPAILERKPDKPKIDNKPKISNVVSDYLILSKHV